MIPRRLRLANGKERGYTLLELLVAVVLIGIIVAPVGTGIFQVIRGNSLSNNRMTAINNLRNAGDWLSRDAKMAMAQSNWVDGDSGNFIPPNGLLTLTWEESIDGVTYNTYKVEYSLTTNNELKRSKYSFTVGPPETWELQGESIVARFIRPYPDTWWQFKDKYYANQSIAKTIIFTIKADVGTGPTQVIETRTYEVRLRTGN